MADPRRIIAVRTNMHLGQTVRFFDWRDEHMREGRMIAMKEESDQPGERPQPSSLHRR